MIIFPSWDRTFGSTYTLGISSNKQLAQKTKKRKKPKKEKSLLNMFLTFERKGV